MSQWFNNNLIIHVILEKKKKLNYTCNSSLLVVILSLDMENFKNHHLIFIHKIFKARLWFLIKLRNNIWCTTIRFLYTYKILVSLHALYGRFETFFFFLGYTHLRFTHLSTNITHFQTAYITKNVMRLTQKNEHWSSIKIIYLDVICSFFETNHVTLLVILAVHKCIILVDKCINLK